MKLTLQLKSKIIELYKTNKYSCKSIAPKFNLSTTTVWDLLKKENFLIKNPGNVFNRKYTFNRDYFNVIDNEQKAYFLGLLYSDGCNLPQKNEIAITLQERDKHILDKFNECIQSTYPLIFCKKGKSTHQNYYKLLFRDNKICEQLKNLGCMPAKSLTLKFPTKDQIPDHLICHFIRGYFDGDGCIYYKKDKYLIGSVSIVSTNDFLTKLKEILELNNIESKVYICSKYSNEYTTNITSTLRIHSLKDIKKFQDLIYKNSSVYLNRKFNKFSEFNNLFISHCNKIKRNTKGDNNPSAKLNELQVREIKLLLRDNLTLSQSKISKMYNISTSAINLIAKDINWKCVKI